MNSIQGSLFDRLEEEFNIQLTDKQKEIVMTTNIPLCAIAAPGSGKTLVYVVRIANLILNDGVLPENILALTFSRASAKDMEDRFLKLFGSVIHGKVHFSTIHSFALQVVTAYERQTGIYSTIIEGDQAPITSVQLLKNIYTKINEETITEEKVEELSNAIGFVKNMMIGPNDTKELRKFRFDIENFIDIYQEYERIKTEKGYMDYDDMLAKALSILKDHPDILDDYRNRYTHIQLDEGQDTSLIQHAIVRLLANPKNNIFLVGDDDQSIYQFRAAFPEELLQFDRTYPKAKVLFMEENFRSSQDIVHVAGEFIKNNKIRYEKDIRTNNPPHKPVKIEHVNDNEGQIRHIIHQLREIEDWSETAILYRNNISVIALVEYLEREGIPYYIRDFKRHFFTHWVLKDILAFLQLAADDTSISAFEQICFKGLYVSKEMLTHVKCGNPHRSVFDRLIEFPRFRHDFQKDSMIRMKWNFHMLAQKPPTQALVFIEHDLGYRKYLENSTNTGISYDTAKVILQYLKLIAKHTPTVADFIQRLHDLETNMAEASYNKGRNAVVLSTIHSSKGLEWDNVFMFDLIQGQFPSQSAVDKYYEGDPRELESERRLFYVGMTRARKRLELLSITSKFGERVEPSMFLREVDRILRPNAVGNVLAALNGKKKTATSVRRKTVVQKPAKTHKTKQTQQPVMPAVEETEELCPYHVNDAVEHKSYGKGKIVAVDDKDITIEFSAGILKKFRLDICIKKQILKKIS